MPERPLPDLPPEMLLSYGGMRELEGAVAMQDRHARVPPSNAIVAASGDGDLEWFDPPPPDAMDISFDTSELDHAQDAPFRHAARGERFNVLRPPVHEPFRSQVAPDPLGGARRQVGQVGRFAILTDAQPGDSQSRSEAILAEARVRLEDRMSSRPGQLRNFAQDRAVQARQLNAELAERLAVEHETFPTAYDRLMAEDPYEDDLE